MKAFLVTSSYADPKAILAPDKDAAVKHYQRAHLLNGGDPLPSVVFYRIYEEGSEGWPVSPTIH